MSGILPCTPERAAVGGDNWVSRDLYGTLCIDPFARSTKEGLIGRSFILARMLMFRAVDEMYLSLDGWNKICYLGILTRFVGPFQIYQNLKLCYLVSVAFRSCASQYRRYFTSVEFR